MMRASFLLSAAVAAMLVLAGCNKAESPDKVQADVAKATSDAASNDANADAARKQAEAQANQDMLKARADVQTQAVDKSIAAVADDAVVEAESQTKIALAKCEALEGDAQKQCRNQANAHLQTVKDRANAAKTPDKAPGKPTG